MKKVTKKLLSMLATVAMTLTLFAMPVSVYAEDMVTSDAELKQAIKEGKSVTLSNDITIDVGENFTIENIEPKINLNKKLLL